MRRFRTQRKQNLCASRLFKFAVPWRVMLFDHILRFFYCFDLLVIGLSLSQTNECATACIVGG
jgi:hypothetical protein